MAISGYSGAAFAGKEIKVGSLIGLQNVLVIQPVITAVKDRLRWLPSRTSLTKFII